MMGYRGYYSYNSMMGPGNFLGGLMMMLVVLIVLIGFILLVIWAIRASNGRHVGVMPMHPAEAGHHEAVAIAKKRLASGEITKEQYEEIIRTLHS